jgi:Fe2+ transport system protein FeoA
VINMTSKINRPFEVTEDENGERFVTFGVLRNSQARIIAHERDESDPCERGTDGCSIAHSREHDSDDSCETW